MGKVGQKTLAFVGLERIGGVMTYDVTNPSDPAFLNYINTRNFNGGIESDSGGGTGLYSGRGQQDRTTAGAGR